VSAKIEGLEAGLKELLDAITHASEEVQSRAAGIVEDSAQQTEQRIRSELSRISNNVASSVTRSKRRELSQRVAVTAKHAHLVEYGSSGPRATKEGWNRGTMPANPIVGRVAHEVRREMVKDLVEAVKEGVPGFVPERVTEQTENVDTAIVAHLSGDATLTALAPGGVWLETAPPSVATPFVLVSRRFSDDLGVLSGEPTEEIEYLVKA
jgi:hypothetical protein